MAELDMDLTNAPDAPVYEPAPEGTYKAKVVDSEVTKSKSGNHMINWTWEIEGGQCDGKKVFDRIMLSGSDKSVEVGRSRLKAMAVACNHKNPNFVRDTEEFHGLSCMIRVGLETREGYEPKNVIRSFKAIDGGASANGKSAPAAQAKTANVPPVSRPGKLPWEK